MKSFSLGSITRNLALLVILTVLPVLVVLLYTGLEQRRHSIENAKHEVLLLSHTMAEVQKDITSITRQMLSTLSLMPEVQSLHLQTCSEIFETLLDQNPDYLNIALLDTNGEVLASAQPLSVANLGDRKHVRETLDKKKFSVGEYIISRVESKAPAFAFAYPVFDKNKKLKAVLSAVIKLDYFTRFHELSNLPEKSFIGVTDYQGIRLFYYPPMQDSNPIGKPIKVASWEKASKSKGPGTFMGRGSDGVRRIFSFEQVRLVPGGTPYLYVWTGIPESHVFAPAYAALTRNLSFFLITTVLALFFAWLIGKNTLISPIKNLVTMTQKFAKGDFVVDGTQATLSDEVGTLTMAFHNMADALAKNQKTLRENEARFRLLTDSLDALVYVADMDTYEIVFINEYGKKVFGDITNKICWQSIQQGQVGPCEFCTNKYLLDDDGNPTGVYISESQNTVTGKWFRAHDRAIEWTDGRIVRFEVATDISDRKKDELVKDVLIEKLEKALSEIKTLRGILPICSFCKNIRNDEGYYERIEKYIHKHSGVDFSHTICPACLKKHYPEEYESVSLKKES
ncbi:MAG: HAMP domain-containing protein [Desulfobulbaceae bacterium]|nr:HAMP domain-containing protein [Desulfobulbaceae bacterium]